MLSRNYIKKTIEISSVEFIDVKNMGVYLLQICSYLVLFFRVWDAKIEFLVYALHNIEKRSVEFMDLLNMGVADCIII